MSNAASLPDLPQLWATLREFIRCTFSLFGAPDELAKRIWLTRAEHQRLCAWLRPLESLLRRLILIEALQLKPEDAPIPEHKNRERATMGSAAGAHFDLDNCESWRTHFNLIAAPRMRAAGARHAQSRGAPLINACSSAPGALRLEAIIRGFNDPAQLAARLARALRTEPERAALLLDLPDPRVAHLPIYPEVADATHAARAALITAPPASDSS